MSGEQATVICRGFGDNSKITKRTLFSGGFGMCFTDAQLDEIIRIGKDGGEIILPVIRWKTRDVQKALDQNEVIPIRWK